MLKRKTLLQLCIGAALATTATASFATTDTSRPNILAIWGDDIGIDNLSAYTKGQAGHWTPNIDRIANEGALFPIFMVKTLVLQVDLHLSRVNIQCVRV